MSVCRRVSMAGPWLIAGLSLLESGCRPKGTASQSLAIQGTSRTRALGVVPVTQEWDRALTVPAPLAKALATPFLAMVDCPSYQELAGLLKSVAPGGEGAVGVTPDRRLAVRQASATTCRLVGPLMDGQMIKRLLDEFRVLSAWVEDTDLAIPDKRLVLQLIYLGLIGERWFVESDIITKVFASGEATEPRREAVVAMFDELRLELNPCARGENDPPDPNFTCAHAGAEGGGEIHILDGREIDDDLVRRVAAQLEILRRDVFGAWDLADGYQRMWLDLTGSAAIDTRAVVAYVAAIPSEKMGMIATALPITAAPSGPSVGVGLGLQTSPFALPQSTRSWPRSIPTASRGFAPSAGRPFSSESSSSRSISPWASSSAGPNVDTSPWHVGLSASRRSRGCAMRTRQSRGKGLSSTSGPQVRIGTTAGAARCRDRSSLHSLWASTIKS